MATQTLASSLKVRGADLPYEDGVPLESSWYLDAMYLLISILRYFWRSRNDVYIGGNMFIYFDPNQVKSRNFRGPDFFVVKGVKDNSPRKSWVVWEEEDLTPNFVIELASPTTADFDLTDKKEVYEQILETPEYVVYDPETEKLRGWRLTRGQYVPMKPNEQGWLWSIELGLWLGVVEHKFVEQARPVKALRFFDEQGQLLLTQAEAAEQRAEAEAEARRAAEQEIARLKALLAQKNGGDS
jgi:Uma2 family endonuclease